MMTMWLTLSCRVGVGLGAGVGAGVGVGPGGGVGVGVGLADGGGVGLGIAGAWLASEMAPLPPPQPTSKVNVMNKLAKKKTGRDNTLALILAHAKCDLETFVPNALIPELHIFCFDEVPLSSSWPPHRVNLSRAQKIHDLLTICSHGCRSRFAAKGKSKTGRSKFDWLWSVNQDDIRSG